MSARAIVEGVGSFSKRPDVARLYRQREQALRTNNFERARTVDSAIDALWAQEHPPARDLSVDAYERQQQGAAAFSDGDESTMVHDPRE